MNKPTIWIGNQLYAERELLLLKLNETKLQLDKAGYSWKMIIVENDHTFTGNSKPYYYSDIWSKEEDFKPFESNIVCFKMQGFGTEQNNSENAMRCDFCQKRAIAQGFDLADPDDICVLTDLDEIPDFRSILNFFNNDLNRINKIYTLQIRLFYYAYNCKALFEDDRVTIFRKKDFKGVDAHRAGPSMGVERIWIPSSGWHFSYLGTPEFVRNKISNFGHSELNTPQVQANIENAIKNCTDVYGRPGCRFTIIPLDSTYPEYLLNNKELYSHNIREFIKPSEPVIKNMSFNDLILRKI